MRQIALQRATINDDLVGRRSCASGYLNTDCPPRAVGLDPAVAHRRAPLDRDYLHSDRCADTDVAVLNRRIERKSQADVDSVAIYPCAVHVQALSGFPVHRIHQDSERIPRSGSISQLHESGINAVQNVLTVEVIAAEILIQ